MKKILLTLLAIVVLQQTFAQNHKFGKVSKTELEEKFYPLDSMANAAYLYKKRNTRFIFVQGQGFIVETKVHERIKIYNQEGFKWATKEIDYYAPDGRKPERVQITESRTFALIDGKVTSTKLSKKEVFTERKNKFWLQKKFTMPNITEGCVLELSYIITSHIIVLMML